LSYWIFRVSAKKIEKYWYIVPFIISICIHKRTWIPNLDTCKKLAYMSSFVRIRYVGLCYWFWFMVFNLTRLCFSCRSL
jgi:hypothetical protein